MTLKDKIQDSDADENVTSVETLKSRNWSRDNLEQRFSEVVDAHESIENDLQKLIEKFDSLPDVNDFLDSWESWLDQRDTPTDVERIDSKDGVPGAAIIAWERSVSLLVDYAVLKSEQEELEYFALKQFSIKFEELLEEYRLAKSYDTIQDALGDQAEKFAVEQAEEYFRKMESMVKEFEKFEQARLEERKADREAFRRVAEQATGVNESEVEDLADKARESIEEFLSESGVLTLDPEELSDLRSRRERDEAAESAASDMVESTEDQEEDDLFVELKGKDLSKQAELLSDLAEELSPSVNDAGQQDVADRTDVTRQAIYSEGGILERCHDEGLFPGVDV